MDSTNPASSVANWKPPPDSGGWILERLNIALIVVSSIVWILRINVRAFMLRSLGWDDLVATVGFALIITHASLEIQAVGRGSGTKIAEIPPPIVVLFFESFATLQLVFPISIAAVRFSVMAFYIKLSRDKWFRGGLYTLAFMTFTVTIVCFFIVLTQCKHIPDYWNISAPNRQCLPPAKVQQTFWAHGIIGIIIDIGLLILPIWVIYAKMKFSTKMVQVILIFCVGILAIIAGIVRIVLVMTTDFTQDPPQKLLVIGPWTDLEGHLGFWTASFPALQPLLRLISFKLGLRSSLSSSDKKTNGHAYQGNPSGGTSRNVAGWAASRASRAQGYQSFNDESADGASSRIMVHGGTNAASDDDAVELTSIAGVKTGIKKRTDVTVHVADVTGSNKETAGGQPKPKNWDAV